MNATNAPHRDPALHGAETFGVVAAYVAPAPKLAASFVDATVMVEQEAIEAPDLLSDPPLDGPEPLSSKHPDFQAAQRDIALAGDRPARLLELERYALHFGKLVADHQIEYPDALDGLLDIAGNNGMYESARDRADIEHIVGQGLRGRRSMEPVSEPSTTSPGVQIEQSTKRTNAAPSNWRACAVSASELRIKIFEPLQFVVPQIIPEGVTILAGKPKAKKSWLMLDVALATAANRFTLGNLKPTQGDVLYLALEDGQRRLQRRVDKLLSPFGETWPERLTFATEWRRTTEGGIVDIEDWAKSVTKPRLVVIDTLEKIRPPVSGKSPAYSIDYEAIALLRKLAIERGLAIVVIHHLRKMDADDPFDTVSGTLGLTGAADTILIIKKHGSGTALFATGRDIEESESAIEFNKDTCRWTILGMASEVRRSAERGRVIAALQEAGDELSIKDIMAATGMSNRGNVDVLLFKMKTDGEIESGKRGHYILPSDSPGKIGKKERSDSQGIETIAESPNLTNLTDLTEVTHLGRGE